MTDFLSQLFQIATLVVAPIVAGPVQDGSGEAETATPATAESTEAAPAESAPQATVGNPDFVAPHLPDEAQEIKDGTFWMPVAASETAKDVDATFNFIMWINYVFTALILALLVIFIVKYRRRPGVVADQSITHNTPIEIIWSVLPTILVAVIFWQGYVTFLDLRTPPQDTLKIRVKAYMWGWNFFYPDGTMVAQEVAVPKGQPVEFIMSSQDTLHSLHLPAFRQKQDVLPDRYTKVWFDTERVGDYRIYCTEYCGQDHSNMYARLQIMEQEDFDAWFKVRSNPMNNPATGEEWETMELAGEYLYTYYGCKSCHSIDGSAGIVPSFQETASLWGQERRLADGSTVTVDETYFATSITNPHDQLVEGFGPLMSLFPSIDEQQRTALETYVRTLSN